MWRRSPRAMTEPRAPMATAAGWRRKPVWPWPPTGRWRGGRCRWRRRRGGPGDAPIAGLSAVSPRRHDNHGEWEVNHIAWNHVVCEISRDALTWRFYATTRGPDDR